MQPSQTSCKDSGSFISRIPLGYFVQSWAGLTNSVGAASILHGPKSACKEPKLYKPSKNVQNK